MSGDDVELKDMGSTNGTFLSGMRIPGDTLARVRDGSTITFGDEDLATFTVQALTDEEFNSAQSLSSAEGDAEASAAADEAAAA